jgi:hypothetical protein
MSTGNSVVKGGAIAISAGVFALVVMQAQPGCDGGGEAKPAAESAKPDAKSETPAAAKPAPTSPSADEPDATANPGDGSDAGEIVDKPEPNDTAVVLEIAEPKAEPKADAKAPEVDRKFFPASKSGIDLGLDKPKPAPTPQQAPNPAPQAPNPAPQGNAK